MGNLVRPPAPALAPFVSAIGYFEGRLAHRRERVLPTGGIQLLVNLDADALFGDIGGVPHHTHGAALQGPYSRPAVVDPAHQRAIIWVAFRSGGAYPFFPVPAGATRDQLVPLDALWGRDGALLRERLLAAGPPPRQLQAVEAALLGRTSQPTRDPAVALAAAALHRGASVTEVADRLGWTPNRLARRFGQQIGLTPKRFARVRRFQRLVAAAGAAPEQPDWGRLAAETGYYDQAHMIHDFHAFADLTPTRYAPRSPADTNHLPLP